MGRDEGRKGEVWRDGGVRRKEGREGEVQREVRRVGREEGRGREEGKGSGEEVGSHIKNVQS